MKPRQTATPEQAMAMLARAVAAVQADKTKAVAMFNTEEGDFWTRTYIHTVSMSVTA
jgi:hypothetical protein